MTPGPWPHLVTSRSQEKGRKVVWPSESSTSSPAPRSATCSSPGYNWIQERGNQEVSGPKNMLFLD